MFVLFRDRICSNKCAVKGKYCHSPVCSKKVQGNPCSFVLKTGGRRFSLSQLFLHGISHNWFAIFKVRCSWNEQVNTKYHVYMQVLSTKGAQSVVQPTITGATALAPLGRLARLWIIVLVLLQACQATAIDPRPLSWRPTYTEDKTRKPQTAYGRTWKPAAPVAGLSEGPF